MQFDRIRVSMPPTRPGDRVLDDAVLGELREAVGAEVVSELIETFVADVPSQVSAIEAADSAESLGRAAHRLKGGSLSLGLIEVRELCVRLEEAGRGGRFAAVAADVGAVRGAVGRAVAALTALLSTA